MSNGEVQVSEAERIDLPEVSLRVAVDGAGPLVIAAHGFPDDASTFDPVLPALIGAGYRVVRPTMRGYAPSGVSKSGRYDLLALGGDLIALADRYSPSDPVRLVGHDWGAGAAYAAAAIAPWRVSHLAALSVPHLRAFLRGIVRPAQAARSWYMGFFQLRGLADAAVRARDLAFIDRLWRDWSPGYTPSAREMASVKEGLRDRVGPALDYYRALPRTLASRAARRTLLAPTAVPTLRLHGSDDGCVGVETSAGEERFHRAGLTSAVIAGAGHFLTRERPDEVSAHLVAFFGR